MMQSCNAQLRCISALLCGSCSFARVSAQCCTSGNSCGQVQHIAHFSVAAPTFETEQERKNYEVLQYLARRPAETAFRIGALAGLSAAYRDLSVVMDSLHDKDIRGLSFPEIGSKEIENTISLLKRLEHNKNLQHQLKKHLQRIIPELSQLNDHRAVASARHKVSLCTDHDQAVIHELFPQLQPKAGTADSSAVDASSEAGATEREVREGGTEAPSTSSTEAAGDMAWTSTQQEDIMRARDRFSRVRYPIWDVTKYDDSQSEGQPLRPRHMSKLPWAVLQPPHLEVSYQNLTAIPLFPMQEASYPTHVDFDFAMQYLDKYTRSGKGHRRRSKGVR